MTRASAARAVQAAEAVQAWLDSQRRPAAGVQAVTADIVADGIAVEGGVSPPTDAERDRTAPIPAVATASVDPPRAGCTGFDEHALDALLPQPAAGLPPLTLTLPTPDWLHHRLTVSGPPADLAAFRATAAGAGLIPWALDLNRLQEDLFHRLVDPDRRTLSVAGARLFARQLRDAVAHRHALALAQVGHSRACPFDLHALLPLPLVLLGRGPDDPDALAWLWTHWGTTQALRHVAEDCFHNGPAPNHAAGPVGEAGPATTWRLSFWSADWTPWCALAAIAARWPALRFSVRPTYETA